MVSIRQPAVAGSFYPADPEELRNALAGLLIAYQPAQQAPKAIIAPHAGYVYSGPTAAAIYACLKPARQSIERVILLGPSHRVSFKGLAASSADYFASPLGNVAVDKPALSLITDLPFVAILDEAHKHEHSLEVQIPFLQEILDRFSLVPIVTGDASAEQVAQVLDKLWGGPETIIVVSSDLSHFHDYDTARLMDGKTSRAIESLKWEDIGYYCACGRIPINGLLYTARSRKLTATTVDLRNSGDTAGSKDRVVGYGAYAFS